MARTTIDTWNPEFLKLSPIFDSIKDVSQSFIKLNTWPTLQQFAAEFNKRKIRSNNHIQIQPVSQGENPGTFDELYESRIFLKGELQTRLENWHDFFNAMCWLQFPKTKSALNALHFEQSKTRDPGTNRSPLENAITLFDECGAVIVSDNEALLELIRTHQWKELFWNRKAQFDKHIQCYVFGHAMHEKALNPYLGMTTHTVLLKRPQDFFQQDQQQQLTELDQQLSALWIEKQITSTKALQPFPLLGVPRWWQPEQTEDFYSDTNYFRPKR